VQVAGAVGGPAVSSDVAPAGKHAKGERHSGLRATGSCMTVRSHAYTTGG